MPLSATELARRVLLHPRGGVETLLTLVGKSETEWLELKASSYPEGGRFEQGTNADDYRWNVAKAVIALANSIGGVVLLGVADTAGHQAINLGTGRGYSVLESIAAFERACQRTIPYDIVARRPGDVAACVADPSLAERLLGWRAGLDLDDMCADHWAFQSKVVAG